MKTNISTLVILALLSGSVYAESATHSHNGRQHTHALPTSGINHSHNQKNAVKKPAVAVKHSHNGRQHTHILPKSGVRHSHQHQAKNIDPPSRLIKNKKIPTNRDYYGMSIVFNSFAEVVLTTAQGGYYQGNSINKVKKGISTSCNRLAIDFEKDYGANFKNVFNNCNKTINLNFHSWMKSNHSYIQKVRSKKR